MILRETLLISFSSAFFALEKSIDIRSCPDQDLGNDCDADCRLIFLACREECTESFCETECLSDYSRCADACPCYHDCPAGCDGCSHPLCFCKNPEVNNPSYRQCIHEAAVVQKDCVEACAAQKECFDGCYDNFLRKTISCPCMGDCSQGCPCNSGYKCQPYITAICAQSSHSYSYIISADGHFKENRHYFTPPAKTDRFYHERVSFATLYGEMFLFGGIDDPKRISKLEGCSIKELSIRLLNDHSNPYASAITVPTSPNEVLICGGYGDLKKCQDFDGSSVKNNPHSLQYAHKCGCFALYDNSAVAICGGDYGSQTVPLLSKVEKLGLSGWRTIQDHPREFRCMACSSIDNGILTVGGVAVVEGSTKQTTDVYLYKAESWTHAGHLLDPSGLGSIMFYDSYFISFGGYGGNFDVEKVQWNGTYVTSSEKINSVDNQCYLPIVFESLPDACADTCEEYCFQ